MGRILNTIRSSSRVLSVVVLAAGAAACGSDSSDSNDGSSAAVTAAEGEADSSPSESGERPQIVVTTNILGDVVSAAVGDQADVEVIMPLGSDPHDFAPSARQAESMENADLLIVNGAGFEEGMLDIIANVSDSGTNVFSFAEQIDLLEFTGEHSDDEHSDEEGEEHSDEEGGDPHIWTDPTRIITAVEALEPVVAGLAGVDSEALATSFDNYLAELASLDAAMEDTLAAVPEAQRVIVTNHEVFGYFADRFDFEVVGAIIPSLTTNAEPSASDLDELVEVIEAEGIQAIFGETTQSSNLADAIADEVGGAVEVVELFSESLGEDGSGAETYIGMMQTNADLIATALSS